MSDRLLTYETQTRAEVRSLTSFAFAVETEVVAMAAGAVEEIAFKVLEARRETHEVALPPLGWVPLGVPRSEAPLHLAGVSGRLRATGSGPLLEPATPLGPEDRDLARALLADQLAELSDGPSTATTLTLGAPADAWIAPLRRVLAEELAWARVPTQSLRAPDDPSSVEVVELAADGSSATLRFHFGEPLRAGTVGSSLVVSGSLILDAQGSPTALTAGGATAHAFQTMAGYERGAGTVGLAIEWE